jgi:hypothetical protein
MKEMFLQTFLLSLGKGENFGIVFSQDFLLLIITLPLLSLLYIYSCSFLGNVRLYNFSLFSSVISFLLSLML